MQEVLAQYDNGDIDYRRFVVDTLQVAAEGIKGRQLAVAENIAEVFYSQKEFEWFGYVKPLVEAMDSSNVNGVLLTAEPQFIAQGIAMALNMTEAHSSQFGVESDGTFAGNVVSALGSSEKGRIALQLVGCRSGSLGFGDSEGDIGMLELVDSAICIRPTDGLRSHALMNGWTVIDNPEQPDVALHFLY